MVRRLPWTPGWKRTEEEVFFNRFHDDSGRRAAVTGCKKALAQLVKLRRMQGFRVKVTFLPVERIDLKIV